MGFNVPWGQFGIHGTLEKYSVGWASSHGCIRMNNDEVAELYDYIPCGTKVTIRDGVYGDFGKGFLRIIGYGNYRASVAATGIPKLDASSLPIAKALSAALTYIVSLWIPFDLS